MPEKQVLMPRTGTDYRDDQSKMYQWPHPFFVREGDFIEKFWSVSSVLELLESFGRVREMWQAQYCVELTEKARNRQLAERWDAELRKMIEIKPIELLADEKHMTGAGYRELNRYAARGTVVHNAIEEWCYKFDGKPSRIDYMDDVALRNYVTDLITDERNKKDGAFFVDEDFCWLRVRQVMKWLDDHVKQVHLTEAPIFNRTFGYAGTLDLILELKNTWGMWLVDAKTSSSHYDSHRIQLSAYASAEHVGIQHDNTLHPMPHFDRVANLYIGAEKCVLRAWWEDGKGVPIPGDRENDFTAFISLLQYVMPRVTPQLGDDGKKHAINPVTIKACSNGKVRASE
jgi:hypothetical protein